MRNKVEVRAAKTPMVAASEYKFAGSNERAVASNGEINASSKRDLINRQMEFLAASSRREVVADPVFAAAEQNEKLHRELDDMGPTRSEQNSNAGPETTGDDRESGQSRRRGGTQLYDAIYLASHELMEPKDGRKALVVFSDGADKGSKENLNDAVDAADHANVAIYTIYFKGEQESNGFGNGSPGGRRGGGGGYPGGGGGYPGGGGGYPGGGGGRRGPDTTAANGVDGKKIMEKIATRTGGRYFEAKKKDNLDEIYGQIAEELRGQYLLTYTPDVADNEGGFHKVALKASKDDLQVVTREGYFAPGGDTK